MRWRLTSSDYVRSFSVLVMHATPFRPVTFKLIMDYISMNEITRFWKIFVKEAHGLLLDVFIPFIRLARWLRCHDRK